MKLTSKMIIVLTFITVLSGAILSTWDNITEPSVTAYKLHELQKAIAKVLPQYDAYKEITDQDMTLYIGVLEDIPGPVGVAFEAVGNGFQGKISIMVGMNPDFTEIFAIKILEQIETPGLGTKIVEDPTNKTDPFWWPNQFKGLQTNPEIGIVKNIKPTRRNDIQAITGATISSKAVVSILNSQIQKAKIIYNAKAEKK